MQAFQRVQKQFADHIRNPDSNPPVAGLEERRLKIYRELFFNNIRGFLDNGFPVLASLYQENAWQQLARDFFSSHHCRSPYFVDISKEFVEFLSNEYQMQNSDPPFMVELAHYEWIELALSIRILEQPFSVWDGQSAVSSLSFSPLAELLSYQFPVHQISEEFQPYESNGTTYLVVNRKLNDEVKFTEVNALSAHLLTLVKQYEHIPVEELIQQLIQGLTQFPEEQVRQGALQIIEQMLVAEILLPE
ncbi:putative DNA-binding domain-containing protein [Paraneptunicella aestuarii]|nr:putative DNA-binding domain-containing protein [Paraneptunicella aestuarii]